MTDAGERTGVLAALSLVLATAAVVTWRDDAHLAVAPWLFGGLMGVAAAGAVFLRTHRATWGREGRYVDYWSIVHLLFGVLGYLVGLDLIAVMVVAAAWELIELAARVREYPTNRVIDLALAAAGWTGANLVVSARPV